MVSSQQPPQRLSNLQMELLKLYPYNVSDSEINDIRKLLADYFAKRVDDELSQLWKQKDWNEQTIQDWKAEHLRHSSPES